MNTAVAANESIKPLDFAALRDSRGLTHSLFRFPGKFHPPLVAYLLSLHPEMELLGDPMVGSGTSAVEAIVSGKDGLFSDIDPLSCLLTRAKSRPVEPNWVVDSFDWLTRRVGPMRTGRVSRREARIHIRDLEGSTRFRAPPSVFHWFQPYIVVNLCKCLSLTADMTQSERRMDALLAVFASVIRRVSRADPSTSSGLEVTTIRKKALKNGLRFDLALELKRKAKVLAGGYREIRKHPRIGSAKVIEHDVRAWSELCRKHQMWPDLVITSPCYMSAIEYWRRHKLEHCWLGLIRPDDLPAFRGEYLGMRETASNVESLPPMVGWMYSKLSKMKRDSDAERLLDYFSDSKSWLTEIAHVIRKSDGTAYVVVGANTNHGVTLNTPVALQEIAAMVGLKASVFMTYRIENSFMQYPTNGDRIKIETVLKLTAS